jgi:vacuolar protein sorting-associated protein 52
MLERQDSAALPAYAAEESKGYHHLETPFRAFNLALIDNASAEYGFLTAFFASRPAHAQSTSTNRKYLDIFGPTFQLGQELTKALIENTFDALGILICVRLTQHLAFELQRRKVPAVEGYINGTLMLLWPRFQQIIDAHRESIRKLTASLPGKPAGTSAMALTTSSNTQQSTAPHPLTQRFAHLVHGILTLSSEAGDDEPVSPALTRLRQEFEAFLTKCSKGIAGDKTKRDRFMSNNYSLVCTILADCGEGKLAGEVRGWFEDSQL